MSQVLEKLSVTPPPPEDEGSKFYCKRCGACCRVTGYVRLQEGELETIAEYLGISPEEFSAEYTRLTRDRRGLSLVEKDDGSCVFLDETGSCCRIHEVKPKQCAGFPITWRFPGYRDICEGSKESQI